MVTCPDDMDEMAGCIRATRFNLDQFASCLVAQHAQPCFVWSPAVRTKDVREASDEGTVCAIIVDVGFPTIRLPCILN